MRLAIRSIAACLAATLVAAHAPAQQPRQATGVKVGEVTQTEAIVWVRRTQNAARNSEGPVRRGRPAGPLPEGVAPDQLEGAVPGAAGQVRVRYETSPDLSDAIATAWANVTADTDYAHQFRLTGLRPATTYYYAVDTAAPGGEPRDGLLFGSFRTAPPPEQRVKVTFTVVTGMAYKDIDHPDGFHIYKSMLDLQPDFLVPTGDTVYMDSEDPKVTSLALARYHWQRMYGMPRHIAFHLRVPAYWEKDDHDTYTNDCWPTKKDPNMLPFSYEQGLMNINQQVPMGNSWYRTVRWGKGLEVWLLEGRDFRSPNNMPDGPDKSIWGKEQKEWLKETLAASDADWRVIVSPTPIVGPDRGNKADNHANRAFQHEGDEIRRWIQQHGGGNLFVCCGDRHWQYHSVHPETGVVEFSCGPASDEHAGGSPGLDEEYHRFHRVEGGFLSVAVEPEGEGSAIAFRLHDVHGKVVYEHRPPRR